MSREIGKSTKISVFREFIELWSSDGGTILALLIMLHTHIFIMMAGYMNFSEAYLLILGAFLGVIRGEYKREKNKESGE
jgi:hypothetical protein